MNLKFSLHNTNSIYTLIKKKKKKISIYSIGLKIEIQVEVFIYFFNNSKVTTIERGFQPWYFFFFVKKNKQCYWDTKLLLIKSSFESSIFIHFILFRILVDQFEFITKLNYV